MRTLTHRRRQPMRIAMTAIVVAFACLLALVPAVLGASPHRLAGPITDDEKALSGSITQVQTALNDLQDQTGTQLWIWFTDTLDGQDSGDFATETAKDSGLGTTDLLLVIALEDREYGYWKGDNVKIDDAGLEQILSRDLEAGLRATDYPGAVLDTAKALTAAMTAGPTTVPVTESPEKTFPVFTTIPGGPTTGSDAGSTIAGVLVALLATALIVGGVWWIVRSGQRNSAGAAPAGGKPNDPNADLAAMKPKDLDELANRILVETDDAIRDSDQELGFAQAQFGDDAAAPFIAAIAAARDDLKGAFTARQKLDDATPEDAPTRRQMLIDLVVACRKAQARLKAETARFEELRSLEKQAPDLLAKLPAEADALEARLPAAQAAMTGLTQFADADWQAVASNVEKAKSRIEAVRSAADEGTKALATGTAGIAAHAARLGEDGLAQGAAFLDAIDHLAAELEKARTEVDAELAAASADLAKAKAAAASGGPDPDVARRLADADRLLAEARTALDPPKPDVTGAYAKARQANELADAIEAGIRTAREQAARVAAQFKASIYAAQVGVTRASDYVAGHRGGIGTEARTRIAEASRHLDAAAALGPTDPAGALAEANLATSLAAQAEQLAQHDYNQWNDPFRNSGPPSGPPPGWGGGAGSNIGGAIIGGIIGGLLSGGGGGHGGGGGGFGGFGGGGGGFGGFGGSSGGGSFGGGGGGGGSSGGGRW